MKTLSKKFWIQYGNNTTLISWVFLRGLALIYLSAFISMAVQIEGLIGADGIIPLTNRLSLVEQFYPHQKFSQMPTIFWLNASNVMLTSVCYAGIISSLLLFFTIFTRTNLIVCYGLYLSIAQAGQDFTQFQWDAFLLETGFLAIFLTWGSGIIIFLFRLLLARFMFMGGIVKIASNDPSWANFTALNFHYETQPLPTPIAYYAHYLPDWFHSFCVGGVFFIELFMPFLFFLSKRCRYVACGSVILLQGLIILTGNYTFFNLLTLLLCIFLLEDSDMIRFIPKRIVAYIQRHKHQPGKIATFCSGLWASLIILLCCLQIGLYNINLPLIEPFRWLLRITSTFSLVNNYGPFAVMTTTRNEIIVQGSNDATHWLDYEFIYKPGQLSRNLKWVIPHQPRLDWQMWFAAFGSPRKGNWFDKFLMRLLEGSPSVIALLDKNPFPDNPPRYIRAIQYTYSFSSPEQRRETGRIWDKDNRRMYWPVSHLK